MTTLAPDPSYYAGVPAANNVQNSGNTALTGNAPATSFSSDLKSSGLLAESVNFNDAVNTVILSVANVTAGAVLASAIPLATENTVSKIWLDVTTAGGTLTSGDCWALLFNSSGTLIGKSASQHTAWQTAGLGGATAGGTTLTAVTTGSLSNLPAGVYYGGVVYTGTTAPTFACLTSSAELVNLGTTVAAANFRAAVVATGVTTTPANVTLTSATLAQQRLWVGLS
jgi:hypothetical protein